MPGRQSPPGASDWRHRCGAVRRWRFWPGRYRQNNGSVTRRRPQTQRRRRLSIQDEADSFSGAFAFEAQEAPARSARFRENSRFDWTDSSVSTLFSFGFPPFVQKFTNSISHFQFGGKEAFFLFPFRHRQELGCVSRIFSIGINFFPHDRREGRL